MSITLFVILLSLLVLVVSAYAIGLEFFLRQTTNKRKFNRRNRERRNEERRVNSIPWDGPERRSADRRNQERRILDRRHLSAAQPA
jgi:hypothetical protein